MPEGKLAKLRASVVNMRALADIARDIGPGGLGSFLYLGRGEETTGGRDKSSILADALESVLGAVYVAHGADVASRVVHQLFDELMEQAARLGAGLDWKTSLQELTSELGLGVPDYVMSSVGPDHEKTFTAHAIVAGVHYAPSLGRSKKEAEQGAAETAWRALTADDGHGGRGRRAQLVARRRAVPELPEVETVRAGLAKWVSGRTVADVEIRHPRAVRRHVAGAADLSHSPRRARRSAAVRRGKYLWLPLSGRDEAMIGHLGMSGQLLVQPAELPDEKHLHVRITFTDGGRELRFVDQRTFGGVLLDALVADATDHR